MKRPTAPAWSRILLISLLFACLPACGSDSDDPGQGGGRVWDCEVELLQAGAYGFTATGATDTCGGWLAAALLGQPIPDVTLPAYDQLPAEMQVTLPAPIGQVGTTLSQEGEVLQLEPVTQQVPPMGTVTVSGTLCPVSDTRVDGELVLHFSAFDCTVTASVTGNLP